MKATTLLKILILEDDQNDVDLLRKKLTTLSSEVQITHVSMFSDARETLRNNTFDVVLMDLGLPDSSDKTSLHHLLQYSDTLPVIIISNLSENIFGSQAIRLGAQDFIPKSEIEKLPANFFERTIRYSIARFKERKRMKEIVRQLQQSNRDLEELTKLANNTLTKELKLSFEIIKKIQDIEENDHSNRTNSCINKVEHSLAHIEEVFNELYNCSRTYQLELTPVTIDIASEIKELSQHIPDITVELQEINAPSVYEHPGIFKRSLQVAIKSLLFQQETPTVIKVSSFHRTNYTCISLNCFISADQQTLQKPRFSKETLEHFKRILNINSSLSLTLLYRIIGQNGGNVWTESSPEDGMTIFMTFMRPEIPSLQLTKKQKLEPKHTTKNPVITWVK